MSYDDWVMVILEIDMTLFLGSCLAQFLNTTSSSHLIMCVCVCVCVMICNFANLY